MKLDKIYKLAEIIVKNIEGDISQEEKTQFDDWLSESEDNNIVFEEFSKKSFLDKKQNDSARFKKAHAFNNFIVRKRRKERKYRNWSISLKVASVVLPIILVVSFFLMDKNIPVQNIPVSEAISPGSSKAILTLSDGRNIVLDEKVKDTIFDTKGTYVTALGSKVEYESNVVSEKLLYHTLDVPRGGEYFIKLSDGTKVWINSESKLRYPIVFGKKERKVVLDGEAYFEVTKNKQCPFIVDMNGSSIEVLGTSFNARSYNDENRIFTTLVEGKVKFSSTKIKGESLVLKPGEQGVINLKKETINKKVVEVESFISWKDGRFVFKEQRLDDIMLTMSRWYDINVFFVNESARKVTFSGNLKRYDNFNKIISMLDMTGMVEFEVKGKTIYVREKFK